MRSSPGGHPQDDCPFRPAAEGEEAVLLDEDSVNALSEEVGMTHNLMRPGDHQGRLNPAGKDRS
jgi:hypothetical protein